MIIQDIIDKLEKNYPLSKAESWDNCGLQAGRRDKEVKKVFIALDPTEKIVEEAIAAGCDMLLTHHPMTLSGLKKINTDSFATRKFYTAIRHDLCCYAMHTNYDVVEMAILASDNLNLKEQEVLEVTGMEDGVAEGIGRVGIFQDEMTLQECAEAVKEAFQLKHVKVFGPLQEKVKKAAICPGSGKSMIGEVLKTGSDVYITGDIGHHDGLDAMEEGLWIIDAGHYGLEHIFIEQMKEYIETLIPEVEVITGEPDGPFSII